MWLMTFWMRQTTYSLKPWLNMHDWKNCRKILCIRADMAGIPLRRAYSRENPYQLLTDWVPDHEPFDYISHQVQRDLNLVKNIGATTSDDTFQITNFVKNQQSAERLLLHNGIEPIDPYMILHPGVSEDKRKYPIEFWIQTGKLLAEKHKMPLLITGSGKRPIKYYHFRLKRY